MPRMKLAPSLQRQSTAAPPPRVGRGDRWTDAEDFVELILVNAREHRHRDRARADPVDANVFDSMVECRAFGQPSTPCLDPW